MACNAQVFGDSPVYSGNSGGTSSASAGFSNAPGGGATIGSISFAAGAGAGADSATPELAPPPANGLDAIRERFRAVSPQPAHHQGMWRSEHSPV